MRLINTKSFELGEFIANNIPEYAILSHTWEAEVISYAEWNEIQSHPDSERAHSLQEKVGYTKIREFCRLCQEGIPICRHQRCTGSEKCLLKLPKDVCCPKTIRECQCEALIVERAWVDTCCIDKSSSAELSEAINSMFKWYQSAVVCIAYLCDGPGDDDVAADSSAFSKSRRFTRGWTLHELIAPNDHGVNFYRRGLGFSGINNIC